MKVKVLKKFRDKETGKIRNVGETFEATEERVEEIKAKNATLVEVLTQEIQEEETGAEEQGEELDDIESGVEKEAAGALCDIAQMTEDQLREFAKSRKIKGYTKMSADELREALEQ